MNTYAKSSLTGVLGFLFIQTVSCILVNKPGTSIIAKSSDSFIICTLLGPLTWIPLLIFPGIIIIAVIVMLSQQKKKISSALISSSFIIYSIGLLIAQYGFELFKRDTDPWKLLLIAFISCFIGFLYAKSRTSNSTD